MQSRIRTTVPMVTTKCSHRPVLMTRTFGNKASDLIKVREEGQDSKAIGTPCGKVLEVKGQKGTKVNRKQQGIPRVRMAVTSSEIWTRG